MKGQPSALSCCKQWKRRGLAMKIIFGLQICILFLLSICGFGTVKLLRHDGDAASTGDGSRHPSKKTADLDQSFSNRKLVLPLGKHESPLRILGHVPSWMYSSSLTYLGAGHNGAVFRDAGGDSDLVFKIFTTRRRSSALKVRDLLLAENLNKYGESKAMECRASAALHDREPQLFPACVKPVPADLESLAYLGFTYTPGKVIASPHELHMDERCKIVGQLLHAWEALLQPPAMAFHHAGMQFDDMLYNHATGRIALVDFGGVRMCQDDDWKACVTEHGLLPSIDGQNIVHLMDLFQIKSAVMKRELLNIVSLGVKVQESHSAQSVLSLQHKKLVKLLTTPGILDGMCEGSTWTSSTAIS